MAPKLNNKMENQGNRKLISALRGSGPTKGWPQGIRLMAAKRDWRLGVGISLGLQVEPSLGLKDTLIKDTAVQISVRIE